MSILPDSEVLIVNMVMIHIIIIVFVGFIEVILFYTYGSITVLFAMSFTLDREQMKRITV